MSEDNENKSVQTDEDERNVTSNEQIKTPPEPRKSPMDDDQERKDLNEHTRKDHDKVHKPYPKDKTEDSDNDETKGRSTEKDKS